MSKTRYMLRVFGCFLSCRKVVLLFEAAKVRQFDGFSNGMALINMVLTCANAGIEVVLGKSRS